MKYLEQLGGALVKAGILKSIRGVSGGYLLAKPAEDITAGDVLRATEGGLRPRGLPRGRRRSLPAPQRVRGREFLA